MSSEPSAILGLVPLQLQPLQQLLKPKTTMSHSSSNRLKSFYTSVLSFLVHLGPQSFCLGVLVAVFEFDNISF